MPGSGRKRKNPAGRNADLHPPDIVARRFGFRAEACGFRWGGSFIPEERACFLPLDFAVVAGGKAVGGVGFVLGTDVERFGAKIGFWLSSRCRGRGMMTAAVRQAVEWMFANTPIIRIFAAAYATNSASQRVLVKAGFRHVGTFRKAFFKNGAFVDGCYYELLKDENE